MTVIRVESGPLMSQAVVHGGVVYVGGQVAATGAQATTVAEQTRIVLGRIDKLLSAAGTSKHKLLSASVWLANIDTFEEMNSAWSEWVPAGATPARATVESRLAAPEYLVEIAVIAAVE